MKSVKRYIVLIAFFLLILLIPTFASAKTIEKINELFNQKANIGTQIQIGLLNYRNEFGLVSWQ